MKYKVGDIVKLRDDLEVGKKYGGAKVGGSLALAIGKKGEIKGILTGQYHIKFASKHGGYHFVSDEMIEGLWEECNQVKKYNEHTLDAWRYAVESKLSEQVSKLKLIDVLNMIAKGELKEGTKVKYKNIEWEYKTFGNKGEKDLVDRGNFTLFEQFYMDALSEEVELIEPPCEHGCIADVGKSIEPTDNTKIEELNIDFGNEIITCNHFQILATNKLNEVINKVNAQTEVILAHRKDIDEIKERLDY